MASNWYDDATLIKGLGEALSNAEYIEDNTEFADFLRKPQKYNSHYTAWEEAGFPTSDDDDGWDEFVEALNGEENDSD